MGTTWVPTECTLPTAEQPLRVAEFDELLQRSAQFAERAAADRLRFALPNDPDLIGAVANLAARESACCSFFTFTLTTSADGASLEIAVAANRTDVLDGLAARA
jgi:hypothetical protein